MKDPNNHKGQSSKKFNTGVFAPKNPANGCESEAADKLLVCFPENSENVAIAETEGAAVHNGLGLESGKRELLNSESKSVTIEGVDYLRCLPRCLPDFLQDHPHWLVCDRTGRPVSRHGVGDSKTKPADWANFDVVSNLVEADARLWLYMVLTEDSHFTVFDIDFKPQRNEKGETVKEYEDRIKRAEKALKKLRKLFPRRYEARSKSGLGVHIMIAGKFTDTGGKGDKQGEWSEVEIYTTSHGIAITGHSTKGNNTLEKYPNEAIQEIRDLIKAKPIDKNKKQNPKKQPTTRKTARSGVEREWNADQIRSMLSHVPTSPPYDEWIKVIASVSSEVDTSTAAHLLCEWSPEQKQGEYLEKLHSGLSQVGIGTLIQMAIDGGWQFPPDPLATNWHQLIADEAEGFPTTRASEIRDAIETLDFVQCLLILAAMSVVYGPSNCGKSFWCLYLTACVAMGVPFFGREVEQGAVLYFGLEGRTGAINRISAMKREGLLSDSAPLHLCFSQLSLLEKGHADCVATTVARIEREERCKLKLVVIDTYARAMAGGDENSGQDTSQVISTVDAIRAKSDAHVMLIHHCGKDEARGARGHSSLRAATDTEIEITRPDPFSPSVVAVKKQRDLPIDGPTFFNLAPVHLGTDSRGRAITSCVVLEARGEATTKKRGRIPTTTENGLLNLLPKGSTTAWQTTAKSELGVSKTVFYDLLRKIKTADSAVATKSGGWEAKVQFPNSFPDLEILTKSKNAATGSD